MFSSFGGHRRAGLGFGRSTSTPRYNRSSASLRVHQERQRGDQLFPSEEDLRPGRTEVAVPALVSRGPYSDAGELLRVHEALLSEDFLRALAAQLDEARDNAKQRKPSSACYEVEGVRVELEPPRPGKRRHPIGVLMQFDAARYRHVKWEDEKRFMSGNIVLLSGGAAFASPQVGIVVESKPQQLRRGQVVVKVVTGLDTAGYYLMESQEPYVGLKFFLLDSSAFYFPYLHVTNALRADRRLAGLPSQCAVARLAPELVRCEFPSKQPAYLADCPSWQSKSYSLRAGLNASQVEAFVSVMAHRVALVQGPPGTGKTYLGTKIAECLVKIKSMYPSALPGPILVITTTNHAVHEFLTRCTHFSDKIIHGYSDKHERAEYGSLQTMYDNCRSNDERSGMMRQADILAMTTTRAAYMRSSLDLLHIKVVIVEEAAEALEGFVLAGLPRHTEHLIQIGDHKQLQPSCSHQPLAESHRLNLSLFERLIRNGAECVMLNEQRRMRPAISRLVRSIYPTLTDHSTTHGRLPVKGVDLKQPVTFLKRADPETQEGTGYINTWEADMAVRLANYLHLQGYPPDDITILTTYRRQLSLIQRKLRALQGDARGIRATTVDNFQGEENHIIILSLVRSNYSGHVGFLKLENRACVALSRARDGFFILGNLDCLVASGAPIWASVCCELQAKGRVRSALPLVCEHGKKFTCASAEEVEVAERGCVVCQVRAAFEDAQRRLSACKDQLELVMDDIKDIDKALGKLPENPFFRSKGETEKHKELTEKRGERDKKQLNLSAKLPTLRLLSLQAKQKCERVESLVKEGRVNVQTDTELTVDEKLKKLSLSQESSLVSRLTAMSL